MLDARLAPSLRIHLDWIQYKTNFRDPVIVRRTTNPQGQPLSLAEIAIDLRQADAARLPDELAAAVRSIGAGPDVERRRPPLPGRVPAVSRLPDLELQPAVLAASRRLGSHVGQRFRGGAARRTSDANHPQAVSDSVADFWTLLRDLENRGQLPAGDRRPRDRRRLRRARGGMARSASRRSTSSAARTSIRACISSSATTRRRVSSARSPAVAHHGEHVSGVAARRAQPRSRR